MDLIVFGIHSLRNQRYNILKSLWGRFIMTSEAQRAAIKKLIREYTKETTTSPEKARAALIKEGIYTRSGKLAPRYGGSRKKPA